MNRALAALAIAGLLVAPQSDSVTMCTGLAYPVQGPMVRDFAPVGRFAGHWGVDWETPVGTAVRAAGSGAVTFSGSVAGNQTVTVDHGGGLKTSYSYLSEVHVRRGDRVDPATIVGITGTGHGLPALHFSVRIGGVYHDPLEFVGCREVELAKGLRLVPVRERR